MKKLIFLIIVSIIFSLTLRSPAEAQTPSALPPSSPQPPPTGTGLLHLPPATDPGTQKAGQLLEQMVEALGGEAYLSLQNMEQSGRTYAFYHGEPTGAGGLFWRFWKSPDKERIEFTKQRDVVNLFVGNQGYEITYRGTTAIEKDKLEDYLRRRSHSSRWVLQQWLGPGTMVLYEGQGVAERKQAEKVSILNAQDDSVTIAIDSRTHLPLRVSFVWRDPKTRDRIEEAVGYDNYRPIQGIMTPFSVIGYRNGEPTSQQFITETKYNLNLPESMFQASLTVNTGKTGRK